jgi:hypothetical protein
MAFPLAAVGAGLSAVGALGSLFGKKKSSQPAVQSISSLSPQQQRVQSRLAKILTEGGTPYTGARVAPIGLNEDYLQNYLRSALETGRPGIERQLRGEFPEEYFNQAIADPTRQQFNERVAPLIRENAELTGNRFADRTAIELGQARGDVESGILRERGRFGLETYRDPLAATQGLTSALLGAEDLFAVPRSIEQARLDKQFEEFLRTNPDSGGMIDAMLRFVGTPTQAAYAPQPREESIFPSLLTAGTSLLGSSYLSDALRGGSTGSTTARIASRLPGILRSGPRYADITSGGVSGAYPYGTF